MGIDVSDTGTGNDERRYVVLDDLVIVYDDGTVARVDDDQPARVDDDRTYSEQYLLEWGAANVDGIAELAARTSQHRCGLWCRVNGCRHERPAFYHPDDPGYDGDDNDDWSHLNLDRLANYFIASESLRDYDRGEFVRCRTCDDVRPCADHDTVNYVIDDYEYHPESEYDTPAVERALTHLHADRADRHDYDAAGRHRWAGRRRRHRR